MVLRATPSIESRGFAAEPPADHEDCEPWPGGSSTEEAILASGFAPACLQFCPRLRPREKQGKRNFQPPPPDLFTGSAFQEKAGRVVDSAGLERHSRGGCDRPPTSFWAAVWLPALSRHLSG
jgi:hypothetical protein